MGLRAVLNSVLIAVAGSVLAPPTAPAAEVAVDLELVLAVDVSGSVDRAEALLQRQGYVLALTDPRVIEAVRSGLLGRIAVTYIEWAGLDQRRQVAPWTAIEDEADAETLAARIAEAPLATGLWTSISGMVEFALPLFDGNGFEGTRRVIDVSGDGPNNNGPAVTAARAAAVADGVTINGLPIINDRPNRLGYPNLPDLDLYYEACVIGGPGAFMVVAEGFAAFAAAIRRKMILEVAGRAPSRRLLHRAAYHAPSCDIGERQLLEFLQRRQASPF